MKNKLLTLLFVFTVVNMFGQTPATKTTYSNKDLSASTIVTNKALKPVKKVPLDESSILIFDSDGSLFSYDFESETIV